MPVRIHQFRMLRFVLCAVCSLPHTGKAGIFVPLILQSFNRAMLPAATMNRIYVRCRTARLAAHAYSPDWDDAGS